MWNQKSSLFAIFSKQGRIISCRRNTTFSRQDQRSSQCFGIFYHPHENKPNKVENAPADLYKSCCCPTWLIYWTFNPSSIDLSAVNEHSPVVHASVFYDEALVDSLKLENSTTIGRGVNVASAQLCQLKPLAFVACTIRLLTIYHSLIPTMSPYLDKPCDSFYSSIDYLSNWYTVLIDFNLLHLVRLALHVQSLSVYQNGQPGW